MESHPVSPSPLLSHWVLVRDAPAGSPGELRPSRTGWDPRGLVGMRGLGPPSLTRFRR
jgi:hypothetical protein